MLHTHTQCVTLMSGVKGSYPFMSTPQVTNGNPHLSPLPINSKQTQRSLPVDCKQRNIDVFPFPITNFVYKPTGSGKANVKTGSGN